MSGFGALAQVLERSLDEIADLPVYAAPPPGVYKLIIGTPEQKDINGKTAIQVEYTVAETIQLNDEGDLERAAKAGDKFSEAFWFNDAEKIEQTLSVLKAKFGGLGVPFGTNNLREIMEKMGGSLVQCVITNRADKNDKSKVYASVRDVVLDGWQPETTLNTAGTEATQATA